jgi:hypothetical protein
MGFARKFLSADGLVKTARKCFELEKFRTCNSPYSWSDCLMSGLAVFGFKYPSLLQFDKDKNSEPIIRRNLRTLYGVKQAPCDTTLRERLDQVEPKKLRRAFKEIFSHIQHGKMLEQYRYLNGYYILSIDGTGQFNSEKIQCENCCIKKHHNGKISYYHQMLGAVIVHPDKNIVIPIAPEPIIKGDGDTKNDCERNAAKRLLDDFRREHPHLKTIVVEDGLGSNFPHLSLLDSLNINYIIGAKPGDHKFMFNCMDSLEPETYQQEDADGTIHEFTYYHNVSLNKSNSDYHVNVLSYTEVTKKGKKRHFTWVTKLAINTDNVYKIMRAGRARWRIENETFNTLKNQGYNFEHNYGHGNKNLCSVMTMLLMLSFLIDQTLLLCSTSYQKARQHVGAFKALFEKIRSLISFGVFNNWEILFIYISSPEQRGPPTENWVFQLK